MSENKCPCCGCPMKETYLGFVCPAVNCAFRCSTNSLPRVAAAMELAKAEVVASNAVWSVPLERLEPAVEAAETVLFQARMRVLEVFK